jgi:hypothetical protein
MMRDPTFEDLSGYNLEAELDNILGIKPVRIMPDARPYVLVPLKNDPNTFVPANYPHMRRIDNKKRSSELLIEEPMSVSIPDKNKSVNKSVNKSEHKRGDKKRIRTIKQMETILSDLEYAHTNLSLEAACSICLNTIASSDSKYTIRMFGNSSRMKRIYERATYLLEGGHLYSNHEETNTLDDEIRYLAAIMQTIDNLGIEFHVECNVLDRSTELLKSQSDINMCEDQLSAQLSKIRFTPDDPNDDKSDIKKTKYV